MTFSANVKQAFESLAEELGVLRYTDAEGATHIYIEYEGAPPEYVREDSHAAISMRANH